jgi:hypothetical protein
MCARIEQGCVSASNLPYSISFPNPKTVTIEDLKKLLSVKAPKVRLRVFPSIKQMYLFTFVLFVVAVGLVWMGTNGPRHKCR